MSNQGKNILIVVIIAVLAVIVWGVLTMPDRRTTGEKLGDAVDELPNGIDNAARELEDRTPGERIGDAINDATDNNN